jgi:hypothetical protein
MKAQHEEKYSTISPLKVKVDSSRKE